MNQDNTLKLHVCILKTHDEKICSRLGALMVVTHGIRYDRISIRAETEVKVSPRFLPWKSAIGGNGGRPRSADYYWQLKSDDTCKRKSNGEVFSMHGPQFGRVKSRRITVGKSLTIFTFILSRRGKPVKSFESRQIYAQIGCTFPYKQTLNLHLSI